MLTNTPKWLSYKEKGLFWLTASDPWVCAWQESTGPAAAAHYDRSHIWAKPLTSWLRRERQEEGIRLQGLSLRTCPRWPNFLLPSRCPVNGTTSQSMLQVGNWGFGKELFGGTLIQPCHCSQSKVLWWCRKPSRLPCLAQELELWLPDSCLVLGFAKNSLHPRKVPPVLPPMGTCPAALHLSFPHLVPICSTQTACLGKIPIYPSESCSDTLEGIPV